MKSLRLSRAALAVLFLLLPGVVGLTKAQGQNTGNLGQTYYDWQSNAGAITRTVVWPDGKVNFAFTQATNDYFGDRGTGIGTYDSTNDEWIPSIGRVENEKTGFGSIARYGSNGLVVAAHTNQECCVYIIPDKNNYTPGTIVKAGALDPTVDPAWPSVMTSGSNRDIIHVITSNWNDSRPYYYRSTDGGMTWDKQNVILPFLEPEYGTDWGTNCCYWMETTIDNCLALVVNNPMSDGMVLYSYDDGETWERKVFYKHPNPFGSFDEPFYYPRWTSCQWDSQHRLHVLYEFNATTNGSYYPGIGGVAYWNETMPYNSEGNTQSAIEGNLVPGQPFVMDSAYLNQDIYHSWWNYSDATHAMWPEYIGYLPPLTDDGFPEDPYQNSGFNIQNYSMHGFYNQGICSFPVLCMVPGTDEMVAVWSAMDENHTDGYGNYYYKLFASYSDNGGLSWSPMKHLTNYPEFDNAEFIYNQAAVVGRKLIIATQTDAETGTCVQADENVADNNYYKGFVFDIDALFGVTPPEMYSITANADPLEGGTVSGTGAMVEGYTCRLRAVANEGYVFVNWTENGEVVSTEALYTFTVTGDRMLVANFVVSGGDHEYVDLGLPSGTLWANCNIGANAPEEYGDYFAWGETQPKSEYTLETYTLYNHDGGYYTKYTGEDGLTALLPEDDAATANWGNDWMMPANDQWQELLNNTYHELTMRNGVNGLLFTSYWNGNSLFLPFAGVYSEWYEWDENWNYQINNGLNSVGDLGIFWSVMYPGCGLVVSGNDTYVDSYFNRYYGYSVRPVRYMPFTVAANTAGGGSVSGEGVYERGETCVLSATPNAGYMFLYWTENGNVVSNEAEYSFVVTNNRNLVANFAMPVVTATADPEEGGTVSGAGVYDYGSQCTLTASPIGNYSFVNWTENGEEVSTETVFSFSVTGDRNLVAHFKELTVTAIADPLEGGTIAGEGVYLSGMECTLTATATEGFQFLNWTENGAVISSDSSYSFTVSGDRNLVANFRYADVTYPDGILTGHFSIDPHHQIHFSMGNLQYIGSAGNGDENNTGAYWKFADHQWDYFGDNGQGSDSPLANRDLFGWGTSGYDHGANCYQPWSTSKNNEDYYAYGCDTCELIGHTGQADWGYNAISNGGNIENTGWRTLKYWEWNYLLNTRVTLSGIRYVGATINGIGGLVLLPDDWDPSYYTLNNPNTCACDSNVISASQWKYLEQHGAIFLPFAGFRNGTRVRFCGDEGLYWSSSSTNYNYYNNLELADLYVYFEAVQLTRGCSVRLVRPAQSFSFAINVTSNPSEMCVVSGGGVYEGNAECILMASADTGYTFINWTENGEVVSTDATYSFTVTGGRSLVANFRYADANITDGALNGQFSVSEEKQIFFSQGNLQYIGSADTPQWKFAEHQWDLFGENGQASNYRMANRDLFCWGTSGYEHGGDNCQPWLVIGDRYYAYGQQTNNLYDRTGEADWGYNAIANGGNRENGGWRTLTQEEWAYLVNDRNTNSGIRYAKAVVNTVYGLILLPDDWDVSYYALNETNESDADFNANNITASQWNTLEQHGAVFLPLAGFLYEGKYQLNWYNYDYEDEKYGCYWSSSQYQYYNGSAAWGFGFSNKQGDGIFLEGLNRVQGNSVRLVRSNVAYSINAASNFTEYGAVEGSGIYYEDTRATLRAVANEGYAFLNWTENGEVVSTDVSYSFTVTNDRNLLANFTGEGLAPAGAVNGMFTVGNGQHVYFSQGNLQYIGTAGSGDENNTGAYWKFADHQWDVLGDNGQGDTIRLVDRDLFGWGTSGYNHGAVFYQPWTTATVNSQMVNYYAYDCMDCGLYDEADWGYNAIANGGDTENIGWRTPTREEWDYLLNFRSTVSGIRFARAQVNGINGLILLPDDWNRSYYTLNQTNLIGSNCNSNIISLEQWSSLEQHGAVFLPAAGYRGGTVIRDVGSSGYYWSASPDNRFYAWDLYFRTDSYYQSSLVSYNRRGYGESVRLVRTINTYTVNAVPAPVELGHVEGTGVHFEGATCTLKAIPDEGYAFYNWTENGEVVSTDAEYSFTVTGDRDLVANFAHLQSLAVPDGWTWYSTYLDGDGDAMLRMMEQSLGGDGVMIKSHTDGFVSFDEYGWTGNLSAIRPESMYMVNTTAPVVVSVAGPLATPGDHPITLSHGWTWMGYPSATASDLGGALSDYNAQDGDIIKIQDAFAQYVAGSGWTGTLSTLTPGEGLMYLSQNDGGTTLTYHVGAKDGALEPNLTGEGNHWTPNVKAYPYNMSVVAVVELDGAELTGSRYELAAFSGDECRGGVRLLHVEPVDRYLAFLTVSGDSVANLRLALYDKETGIEYHDSNTALRFEQNAVLGAVKKPMVVRFGKHSETDEAGVKVTCYPNPVDRNRYVRVDLSKLPCPVAKVELVNALGVVVRSERTDSAAVEIQAPATAGVYAVRVTVDGRTAVCAKLIVE